MFFNKRRYEELKNKIDLFPRVRLAELPTSLHEAPLLSKALGGPRIFFKRDDLTGLAGGGNKTRMLEFRLVNALNEGADTVIAGYGIESNHARQTAAACNKLGLDCYLVLTGRKSEASHPQGNFLLDQILGAKIKIVGSTSEQKEAMESLLKNLSSKGRKPYITGVDDYDLSALAYVNCMLEMCSQLEEMGIEPDYFFVSSEGSTQAGLLIAAKYLEIKAKIIGISPMKKIDKSWRCSNIVEEISRITKKLIGKLGIDLSIDNSEIINSTDYVGDGYGKVTEKGLDAMRLVARKEGIILDPVYTAKAMAGLIDKIKNKKIDEKANVVFIHTGGFPLVFAYSNALGEPISLSSLHNDEVKNN